MKRIDYMAVAQQAVTQIKNGAFLTVNPNVGAPVKPTESSE